MYGIIVSGVRRTRTQKLAELQIVVTLQCIVEAVRASRRTEGSSAK